MTKRAEHRPRDIGRGGRGVRADRSASRPGAGTRRGAGQPPPQTPTPAAPLRAGCRSRARSAAGRGAADARLDVRRASPARGPSGRLDFEAPDRQSFRPPRRGAGRRPAEAAISRSSFFPRACTPRSGSTRPATSCPRGSSATRCRFLPPSRGSPSSSAGPSTRRSKAGAPVETWASVRLDLQIEVRPREEQVVLTPITPATPLPPPFDWGDDTKWFEAYKVTPPTDGTVPLEDVEKPPTPKKMKWSADSYKGPFSCKAWIRVSPDGLVQQDDPDPGRAIRSSSRTCARRSRHGRCVRPASRVSRSNPGASCRVTGNISYSIDLKQVNNLRKTLGGSRRSARSARYAPAGAHQLRRSLPRREAPPSGETPRAASVIATAVLQGHRPLPRV